MHLTARSLVSLTAYQLRFFKKYSSICSEPLYNIINDGFRNAAFDKDLKYADIIPVHKKDDTTEKSNYRPISLLPVVAKPFERFMQRQIGAFMDIYLSPYLCGYRKGFNAQHALLSLIEKWRISLDKRVWWCSTNGPFQSI